MLKEQDYVDENRIFLLGASQGGVVSAITAADHREDITGVVLLYPAFVLVDDAKERFGSAENVPDRYQMFIPLGRIYAEPLFNYNIYEDIKDYDKDVLIIHGDADEIAPVSYSEQAVEVYSSAELKVLPGAGHGFYGEDKEKAVELMIEFFNNLR